MSELLPCPFPMEQKPVIEKIGNCYEINCIEVRRGIYIKVVVRVREDIGDEKMLAEIWNHRVYPPEVQQAIERMKPKKVLDMRFEFDDRGEMIVIARCPACDDDIFNNSRFCDCGQKLDWNNDE